MIVDLLEVLALMDERPVAEEVADALWLARHLPERSSPRRVGASSVMEGPVATGQQDPPRPRFTVGRRGGAVATVPGTSVHLPATGASRQSGVPASVPAVPAIRSALAVQRALRPLHRFTDSTTEFVLDEEATADAVADSGIWMMNWRPAPARWLDVVLVLDESASMAIWQRTIEEFHALLALQGAFRDIRLWRVRAATATSRLQLRTEGSSSLRDPGELISTRGQRIVAVISDCIDPMWTDGRMAALLETWGAAEPVVIVQPLPQRLWARHCPLFTPVHLRTSGPATPNALLEVRPRAGRKGVAGLGIPTPIVELDARWLQAWAGLIGGTVAEWVPGVVLFTGVHQSEPLAAGSEVEQPSDPLSAVLQFRAGASPTAFQLASYLAATPLSLPLMRLVQQVMLPRSRPAHLAEVLLSGLIQGTDPTSEDAIKAGYGFRAGVRELLLSGLSRTQVLRVAAEASLFVNERLGSALDFRALFAADSSRSRSPAGEPFAVVASQVLRALGGSYSELAKGPSDRVPAGMAAVGASASGDAVEAKASYPATAGGSRSIRSRDIFHSHPSGDAVTSSQPEQSGGQEPYVAEQPAVMGGVPVRNPNFTGREQLLLDLRAQLGMRASVLLPQALHGLGGVGKTQVAVEYVHRFATDYELVWWISAEQTPLIRSSLSELGARLGLAAEDDTTRTIANVLEALRQGRPYRRWILVFDNADSPEAVEEYLPYPTGHILVTSRNPAWSSKAQALEVDVFPREESIQFIQQRGRDISVEDADRLADALGDLPLALEQAAVWQRETGMPVPEYLGLLDERMSELLSENSPPDYPRPVAATWGLALDQLTEQWPAAAELLRLCAFFSPEPIAERLLTAGRVLNLPDQLGRALRDPLEFSRAKRDIGRYALAKTNPGEKTIQVHRLVQAILRDQMTKEQRAAYRATVHQLMYAADPGDPDERENWERLAEISNHVFGCDLISAESAEGRQVVLDLIRYRYERGDYQSCRELGEATVLTWWRTLGPDHEQTLVAVWNLANAWRALNMTTESREYTRDTLERMRRVLGEDHEHTLNVARSYAADLRNLGDYPAARALDEEILPKYRRVFGEDHMQTLRCANNLGVDLRLSGDFYAARDLDQDTLGRSRRYLGAEHKDSLYSAGQLVRDLRGCGRYEDALALLGETLPIYEVRLGLEHPGVVGTRLSAAATLRRAGRYEEAKTEAEQCLKVYRARFGDRHQNTITAMTILGEILRCLGDIEAARQLSEPAAALARKVYESHNIVPYLFDNNLAMILRAQSEFAAARVLDEAAREAILADRGPDHPYSLCVTANLASDFSLTGDYEQARVLDDDTLERSARVRHPEHPLTLGCIANLGLDLRALGDLEEGQRLLDEALGQLMIYPGMQDPEVFLVKSQHRVQYDIEPPSL
jgi:tetratricopeptide (TPR) repeat protein